MEESMICQKCGQNKPLKEFVKHVHAKNGRAKTCITCFARRMSQINSGKSPSNKGVPRKAARKPAKRAYKKRAKVDRVADANEALARVRGKGKGRGKYFRGPGALTQSLRKVFGKFERQGAEIKELILQDGQLKVTYQVTEEI